MNYWLMKSEPDVFSIDDLAKKKRSAWDGVRNYQARNYMRDGMKVGDLVFFYHSNAEPPGIAGIAKVACEAYPDPTQFDKNSEYFDAKATKEKPIWQLVDIEFVEKFKSLVSLDQLKKEKSLEKMPLVQKGTRLSVMPVKENEWKSILKLLCFFVPFLLSSCANTRSEIIPLGSPTEQEKIYSPTPENSIGVYRSSIPFQDYKEIGVITLHSKNGDLTKHFETLRKLAAEHGAEALIQFKWMQKAKPLAIEHSECDAQGKCSTTTAFENENHYTASATMIRRK